MKNELILFETADKEIKLNVSVKDSTVWLNRNQLAELFERDVKTIGKHINNALKEELDNSVVAKFATTALDGKIYQVEHYNLDMIISVGYRVKSNRGVEFRKWAFSLDTICPAGLPLLSITSNNSIYFSFFICKNFKQSCLCQFFIFR